MTVQRHDLLNATTVADGYVVKARLDVLDANTWIDGADKDKVTGTVPWRYDLDEARYLLLRAVKAIDTALKSAENPDA